MLYYLDKSKKEAKIPFDFPVIYHYNIGCNEKNSLYLCKILI